MVAPAKLTPPALERVHPRTRLYRRLDGWAETPVIWVSAPAGSGKTTLVAGWLQSRDIPGIWYRMDCDDRDPAGFFHYLGEALRRFKQARKRAMPSLTPEYQAGLDAFARRFFRKLFATMPEPGVLVLDNMEAMDDEPAFHAMLRHGLEEVTPGRQVIIISRGDPPHAYARFMAGERMARLGWPDLQLDDDESRAIIRLLAGGEPVSETVTGQMTTRACGWVTGLVLQCHLSGDAETALPDPDGDQPGRQFAAYFAEEIFRRLPSATRSLLLRTAWLTSVRPGIAARLTGIRDAGRRLDGLARKQMFVTRLVGGRPAYAYHPLLRTFLLEQVETALSLSERRELMNRAATLLAAAGEIDPAADLYRQAGNREGLESLIRRHADELLQAGRHRHLQAWLDGLEPERVIADPALAHWQGSVSLLHRPREAGEHFRRAYDQYLEAGDAVGACRAWLGVMDSIMYANDSLEPVPRWLEELERLRERFGTCSDPVLEGRIAFTAFNMGFTASPGSRLPEAWSREAERLRGLLPVIADDSARCLAAAHLAMYFTWHPQPARLKLLADYLSPWVGDRRVAPFARVVAALVEITRRWNTGQTEGTAAFIDSALELAAEEGIAVGMPWLLSASIIYHLSRQEEARARKLLSQYRQHIRPDNRHEQVHYHYLAGWLAWLGGDNGVALEHTRRALADIRSLHTPHFELLCGCAHAFMLLETGQGTEAAKVIEQTRRLAVACHSRSVAGFHLGLLEAWAALREGARERVSDRLAEALACGRELDLQVTLWHVPPVLSRLCVEALERNIETAYVGALIRRNRLARPPGTEWLDAWPASLKIHALARFRLVCDGREQDTVSQSHRKPLRLLKVIVALGGRNVPAERVEDILWPEAEGSDARRSLITTLQRLRKLLGTRECIHFEDGMLGLDAGLVWLDVWALEAGLEREEPERIDQALRFYEGPLLPEEGDAPWLLVRRERLHDDVLLGYERLAEALIDRKAWKALAELGQRGLRIDDLHEPFYRHLMLAHASLGRQAEAVRYYHRCRRRLHDALDTEPSHITRELFATLRSRSVPASTTPHLDHTP